MSPLELYTAEGLITNGEFLEKISQANLPTITTNKKITYYNVPAAFDIETSSFSLNGEKCACMYVWQFGICGYVTYGRTWAQYFSFTKLLSEILGLSEKTRLIIYVHNLPYEFQFIRKRIEWDKVFFLDKRKPVYALSGGFEYRCSFKLSSKSLRKVGEDLRKYKVEKRTGDLDYSLVRTSITPLSEKELGYCEADIRVILSYIQEKIEEDGNISLIPLTNTGYVRNYCRKRCFARYKRYRALMSYLKIDSEEYSQLKRGFAGGFTHACAKYSGKRLKNVASFDFTSSYPYVMLAEKFPMASSEMVVEIRSDDEFEWYLKNRCCLMDITFYNLRPKLEYDHPMSVSKLLRHDQRRKALADNGRVVTAPEATVTITEQDFFVYRKFYSWDKMEVHTFRTYKKGYLPTAFVKAILELYKKKTELKGVEGKELEYMISKNMLNSAYGMCVTDIVRDVIEYINDNFVESTPDLEEAISIYNKNGKRFLFYPWGVWVTAYSRYNLFTGIEACGEDYVYSDTDSIKVLNYEKHMDYIREYNASVTKKLQDAAKAHGISPSEFSPLNKKGEPKPLGVWDFEGVYDEFKTVGAKRYMVRKGTQYYLTVAGVNKKMAMEYIELEASKRNVSPFSLLKEDLVIPAEYSGRLILDYCNDQSCSGEVVDYLGNKGRFSEKSYIHMEPSEYTLTFSEEYKNFLNSLLEVRIFEQY